MSYPAAASQNERDARNLRAQEPPQPYDSPARRAATHQAMRDPGVPEEARTARSTADRINGQDPRGAAQAAGARVQPGQGRNRLPARQRGLSR